MRLVKHAKKILIPAGILIAVFMLAGMVYGLLSGPQDNKPAPQTKKADVSETQEIKPTKPGPNAPENVSAYLYQDSVAAGSNAGVTVKTNPDSDCTISVVYGNLAAQDSGLAPKKADDYGTLSWTWTVAPGAPAGTWPVKVTCVYNGRSGVSIANLNITK